MPKKTTRSAEPATAEATDAQKAPTTPPPSRSGEHAISVFTTAPLPKVAFKAG